MRGLVLSLFPGIGLLDMAFEEAGFCVVRGPDLLWGGDVRRFHPPAGRFDGVIGGPPCQFASSIRHMNQAIGHKLAESRIPEYERCVAAAQPDWFLMENVPDAPLPEVAGYRVHAQLLRDHWCGGETMRHRRFSFGTPLGTRLVVPTLALHRPDPEPAALASGGNDPNLKGRRRDRRFGHMGWKTAAALANHYRLQGLPPGWLDDAPLTIEGKIRVVGNGVPLAMGRAVAAAVVRAIGAEMREAAE